MKRVTKRSGIAILTISALKNKLLIKTVTRDKEGHYILMKVFQNMWSKYWQNWGENSTMRVGDKYHTFSNRLSIQIFQKENRGLEQHYGTIPPTK